jgi:predicted restriction endonuclease
MTPAEHENYANELLSSLSDDHPEIESLDFVPVPNQKGNAARAMVVIHCHRLFKTSKHRPTRRANTTYGWKDGIFNYRNNADRGYVWTKPRRTFADKIHRIARDNPVAYLLACSNPSDTTLYVWVIPEPILYDALSRLPPKERKGDQEYTIEIKPDKQRIENCAASPDLAPYFQSYLLSRQELRILKESRAADDLVETQRKNMQGEEEPDTDKSEGHPATESDTSKFLAAAAQQLTELGEFDPKGITDGRERVLSSIVRRRGQPAFRQHLLAAYNGRCAFTGCDVEAALDAAHIVAYRGPNTNHPANGLLLRTDLHTLFDLKLVSVDVATMTLLISPSLAGTCYEQYRGRLVSIPDDPGSCPSREALEQHRQASGL